MSQVPPIDKSRAGKVIPNFAGNIVFKNVDFAYPLRSDTVVSLFLRKFDICRKALKETWSLNP